MVNTVYKGSLRRFTATYQDATPTALDPTTVGVTVQTPELVETTYYYGSGSTVVKSATGVYYTDVSLDTCGMWAVRWFATGTGQTAWETQIYVAPSEF